MYTLLAKPAVEKDLYSINPKDLPALNEKIKSLMPQPRQSHTEKLRGTDGYRLRVGKYRILYEIDDKSKTVTVCKVLHRKEAYR